MKVQLRNCNVTYWIGCIDFGELVEIILSVRNQILLLGAHAEQRLWKHNETQRSKKSECMHTLDES